ncbi:MAG: 3-deoxy-manno-octulosonate cytidylyltransferase [SAR86 cluster bacterium]|nr:3-deoxy-manno-octulosonate cytidylyltransferase [SAR86 cluster bacterium]
MSESICLIPARMNSSRFPGKPLEKINGIEMIKICYQNAESADCFDHIYIATPDKEIMEFCKLNSMHSIMTSDKHERCTSRTLEAVLKLNKLNKRISKIVMLQGDEPLISSNMLKQSLESLQSSKITNLVTRIRDTKEIDDVNEVKVVLSANGNAIYFSRSRIPATKDDIDYDIYKQVCAIAFDLESLKLFENLPESTLERIESIDMNRLIENEIQIKAVIVNGQIASVDTPSDLMKVENLISNG